MDNKKFEQLIHLITNENEEQARALFHDIVVEKSREIYEGMMDQEGGLGGQVGDFQDEIASEEQGMTEEDEDGFGDLGDEGDEEEISLDGDEEDFGGEEGDFGAEGGEEGLEDRVVSLEDKLDELMAEFEELMADEEGEEEHAGGFGDEEGDGSIEGADDGEDFGDEEESEEQMMEAVALQKVSVTHGDNGQNTKSPALTKPKVVSTGAKAVSFSQGDEKGRTAPTAKDIPGSYKNAAGQKKQDLSPATKPTTTQAAGVNTKSPVSESRRK